MRFSIIKVELGTVWKFCFICRTIIEWSDLDTLFNLFFSSIWEGNVFILDLPKPLNYPRYLTPMSWICKQWPVFDDAICAVVYSIPTFAEFILKPQSFSFSTPGYIQTQNKRQKEKDTGHYVNNSWLL